jgi:uncharacterized protein YecE (DUF72 family)
MPETATFDPLAAAAASGVRVGIGGWTYAPWRGGAFYPPGLVQRRELEYASRALATIEINGTWYGAQKPTTYAKWRDETPPGFVFSAKAPMRITQSRRLAGTGPQIEDFVGGIAELGDRLGPLVWQFDQGVTIEATDFEAFLALLPRAAGDRRLRHVLDVRDRAFVGAAYLDLARRHGLATVFTDSPDHPSFADLTADFVYARLMRAQASIATGYDAASLARWADRARKWHAGSDPDDLPRIEPVPEASRKPREVFVHFIAAAKERNPAAAMALQRLLAR